MALLSGGLMRLGDLNCGKQLLDVRFLPFQPLLHNCSRSIPSRHFKGILYMFGPQLGGGLDPLHSLHRPDPKR